MSRVGCTGRKKPGERVRANLEMVWCKRDYGRSRLDRAEKCH